MKNYTYISFKEDTFNSNVFASCPKLSAKFNTKGSSTFTDEEGVEQTTTWDYTWKETIERLNITPSERVYMPKVIEQQELLNEEGVGTGVMVDVEVYVKETVSAPTEEDPNATVEQYVKHTLFIVRLPECSNMNSELRELKDLGLNLDYPLNTVMTVSETQELMATTFHKNDELPTL